MFYIPMVFMLAATLTQLIITVVAKLKPMFAGAEGAFFWGNWFQLFFAATMEILALFLVYAGIKSFIRQAKAKKA